MKGEIKKYSVNNLCAPVPLRAIISRKDAKAQRMVCLKTYFLTATLHIVLPLSSFTNNEPSFITVTATGRP